MKILDIDTIARRLEDADGRRERRRRFLAQAAGAGAALGGLALLSACGGDDGTATPTPTPTSTTTNADVGLLNFALNLQYLEAQYYSFAVFGAAVLPTSLTGVGTAGALTGGAKVTFADTAVAEMAVELAYDELAHVNFLRTALGGSNVAVPAINIDGSATGAFTALARTAGVAGANETFNPYAGDDAFLLGAFILEDVVVSALKGAAQLLTDTTFIGSVAGMLATDSYHAGTVRTQLNRRGFGTNIINQAQLFSDARDSFDGATTELDQGITGTAAVSNIVPADASGIVPGRTSGQVLNVLFQNRAAVSSGGFFPSGVGGPVRSSAAQA